MRKHVEPRKFRYFYAGEYGSLNRRPHYHCCILGFDFPDKTLHSTRFGIPLYSSNALAGLWPYGFSAIGCLTFESAAYVARYICSKITGDDARAHYDGRVPEFAHMSTRPAIGKDWYNSFKNDVYNHDLLVIRNGVYCRPPRYYDKLFSVDEPQRFEEIKANRAKKLAESDPADRTRARLETRENVLYSRITSLVRALDYIEN